MDKNYNKYRDRGGMRYVTDPDRPAYSCNVGFQQQPTEKCICTSQPISLAMAYVKDQAFKNLFAPSEALAHGTLFEDLYMPYCMGGGRRC